MQNSSFYQNATVTDASAVTYTWAVDSGPGGITSSSVEDPLISGTLEGTYVIRLTATDVAGNSTFDTFSLNWDSTKPVVAAGTDKIVGVTTLQDATVSDSNTVTYSWTQVSGPGSIIFGSPATEDTTMFASIDGVYSVQLLVIDSYGNYDSDLISFEWDTTAPSVNQVLISNSDGSYATGSTINTKVIFSEPVDVTGVPQINLDMDGIDRLANYSGGTGSSTLTFSYTITTGDNSSDLDYVNIAALSLSGGTILDALLLPANLGLPAPGAVGSISDNQAIVIDTISPGLIEITTYKTDDTYTTGESIDLLVFYNEIVTVTGTPTLTLETGVTDKVVNYNSGSGTSTLTFTYLVSNGELTTDLDYVSTSALSLNGGFIRDSASNNAGILLALPGSVNSISDDKQIIIDTVVPVVSEVNTSATDGSYGVSAVIPIQIIFSEPVIVSGTPQIILETGATDIIVDYTTGSTTNTLRFDYTIGAGENSLDLDYKSFSALSLNGGAIGDAANSALLTLSIPGITGSISDNQAIVIDTSAPKVIETTSTSVDGTYTVSSVIDILVEWTEVVNVVGTPQLTLETGATDAVVDYFNGSGSSTLTFRYTVSVGENTSDLEYAGTTALALNGGTIRNTALQDADLTLAAPAGVNSISDNQAIVVDGLAPTINQVSSTTTNGSYRVGEVIDILVEFDEAVTVTGTPQINIEAGATDIDVNYTSGSGASVLTFTYTVGAADSNIDLDYTSVAALGLSGGTIEDVNGNTANLILTAPGAVNSISDDQAIIIDNTAPSVSYVQSSNIDAGHTIGAVISVEVVWDEIITVTGIPQIMLELGAIDMPASYTAGTGTDTLTFTYTIAIGDTNGDLDYTSTFALAENGGSMEDSAGNTASVLLPLNGGVGSISDDQAIVVDTSAPILGQVLTFKANGTYGVSEVIDLIIEFSENIYVTGTPQLTLETGVLDQNVDFSSGDGTNLLTFSYTVAANHISSDLDYKSISSLNLNGGALKDIGGNNAPIVLVAPGVVNSISDDKNIVIDGIAPSVVEVRSTASDGGHKGLDTMDILVVFDEPVYVSGLPTITLETGATDAVVNYSGGSTTDTLTFAYTIGSGQLTNDLDYVSTSSLSLNGGQISDAVPNNAIIVLASPGVPGSISDNQQILVDSNLPAVDAGADASASTGNLQDATLSDDTAITISWSMVSGPGTIIFDDNLIEDPTISADTEGTYVVQVQVTDAGGNIVTDTINFDWDSTPPPALDGFSALTSTSIDNAMIDITVNFPADVTDYNELVIRGIVGATPPADCISGTILKTYNLGSFSDDNYSQNTSFPGGFFSARACISDASGNLTSTNTFTNIQASKKHKIFTTSSTWDGNFGADYNSQSFIDAQEGADYRCQFLADAASISTSVDKWIGILSTSYLDASSKVAVNGPGFNVLGLKVFDNKFDLWDSSIDVPVGRDEYGSDTSLDKAFTGTLAGGTVSASNCTDFTDGTSGAQKRWGSSGSAAAAWISSGQNLCNVADKLYCVSQMSLPDHTDVSLTTGASAQEIKYSFELANDINVERFFQKIEVYRKTSAGAPTQNCDGSDGSVLSQTFTGPFTKGDTLTFVDLTPGIAGTSYNFTVCTYDNDSNVVIRDTQTGITSGL